MKVEFQKLPKGEGQLRVEVSVEELQPYLLKAARGMATRVVVPGFRPEKTPYEVLAKRVGEAAIYEAAFEDVVRVTLSKALEQEKIELLSSPSVDPEKIAPGNPMVYVAKLALYPEVELVSYEKLKARPEKVEIKEEEIEKMLLELRKLRASEKVVDREAKKGDKVLLDFDVLRDKVVIENGAYKQQSIELGSGNFIPGFEEALTGVKKGTEKSFTLRFPKEYHEKSLADKDAEFKVKVHDVYEVSLPEANDEWAKSLGRFQTLAEMQEAMRANLRREKGMKIDEAFEKKILEEMVEKSKISDIAPYLVEHEVERMMSELRHEVEANGGKFVDYLQSMKKTEEELRKGFVPQAEKRLKSSIVLQEVAAKEKITVSEEDLGKAKQQALDMYADNEKILEQVNSEQYQRYLHMQLLNRAVIEWIKKKLIA